MVARFNGNKHPTRRSLGVVGRITLDRARERAQSIHRDPRPSSTDTFGQMAERYFGHIQRLRRSEEVERAIRRQLYPKWETRAMSSITKRDVIEAVDSARSHRASNALSRLRGARRTSPEQLADAHGRSEQREGQPVSGLLEVRYVVQFVAGKCS